MPLQQLPGPTPSPTPLPAATIRISERLRAWAEENKNQSGTLTIDETGDLLNGIAQVFEDAQAEQE